MEKSIFFRTMKEVCTPVIENAQDYPRIHTVINQVEASRRKGCYKNIDWLRTILEEISLVSTSTYDRLPDPNYEVSRDIVDGICIVFGLGEEKWHQMLAAAGYLFRPDNTKDCIRREFVIRSHADIQQESARKNTRARDLLVECNEALIKQKITSHLFRES